MKNLNQFIADQPFHGNFVAKLMVIFKDSFSLGRAGRVLNLNCKIMIENLHGKLQKVVS